MTNSTCELIDKLHNLSMRRKQNIIPLIRPIKRHLSDLTELNSITSTADDNKASDLSRSSTAPHSLLSTIKIPDVNANRFAPNRHSTFSFRDLTDHVRMRCGSMKGARSYDSGLNDEGTICEEALPERCDRSDSGISIKENKNARFWKPGEPDENFLKQEETKLQVNDSCCDCGEYNENEITEMLEYICKQCQKSRVERKEAIIELIENRSELWERFEDFKRGILCSHEKECYMQPRRNEPIVFEFTGIS